MKDGQKKAKRGHCPVNNVNEWNRHSGILTRIQAKVREELWVIMEEVTALNKRR